MQVCFFTFTLKIMFCLESYNLEFFFSFYFTVIPQDPVLFEVSFFYSENEICVPEQEL